MNNPLSIDNNISEIEENKHDSGATLRSSSSMSRNAKIAALFCYCVLFLLVVFVIATTLYSYPLFPVQPEDLEWNNNWLIATVFDFYGACLCFGGVVMSSESSWASGIAWNLGFVTLGSPVCCLWVILRIRKHGSLRLVDISSDAARRDV